MTTTSITLKAIAAAVEAHYDLRPGALRRPYIAYHQVLPRQMVALLGRRLTDLSLGQIGYALGGWSSRGVAQAITAAQRRLAADSGYRAEVESLVTTIAVVAERGLIAGPLTTDHDVIAAAAAVGSGSASPFGLATDTIVSMASCLVGQASALDGEEVEASALIDAIGELIAARDARDEPTFEAVWDRLVTLYDAWKDV